MVDEFFLTGLDQGRWFSLNFEVFSIFGYVGDREKLLEIMRRKSLLRKVIEVFAPRINLASIINALSPYPLLKSNPQKSIATDIINIVTSEENRRTLTELLARTYTRGRKNHRYFDHVSKKRLNKATLFEASPNALQGQLITVEGQLVHRSTVAQFNSTTAAVLRTSTAEWLLADYPPHAFVNENSRFNGKVLLLREDPGFSDTFANVLPFCRYIGWYPYVRVTGFFDATNVATERLPSLSLSLLEYRRPHILTEVRASLVDFLTSELHGRRIYLKSWSDLIVATYLAPILFAGSNLTAPEADKEMAAVLHDLEAAASNDMPALLKPFYGALP